MSAAHADDIATHLERKVSVPEGLRFHTLARPERIHAKQQATRGDTVGAHFTRHDVKAMQAKADAALDAGSSDDITVAADGSLVSRELGWKANLPGVLDVLTEAPAYVEAQAALDRLEHAPNGTLTMAVDLAASIQAKDSVERMLCYQMASAHHLGQRIASMAAQFLDNAQGNMGMRGNIDRARVANVEAVRCIGAQARAADAFQKGALVLDKLRNGGRQHVTVQHVQMQVQDGGQAVVTGCVERGLGKPGGKADAG